MPEEYVTRTTPDTEVVQETPATEVVDTTPNTVVERRPVSRTVVQHSDPVGNAFAASQLIQTIVWSVVVLVLLVVALWLLHVYTGIF
ncbi:MAG TPA: hypothetical protein VFB58_03225 [Chloroflexota bacterium]|nr:hypothetical protein [Chloroflexota bacterium]